MSAPQLPLRSSVGDQDWSICAQPRQDRQRLVWVRFGARGNQRRRPVARRHRIADHYRIVSVGCPVPGAQAALSRRSARPPVGTAYSPSTDEARERIRGLLEAGQTYGIGITFEPDGQGGWKIGYMRGMGGGDLATPYDLETAVAAADRPPDELAHRLAENTRDRGLIRRPARRCSRRRLTNPHDQGTAVVCSALSMCEPAR